MSTRPRVLVLATHFAPSQRGGGLVTALASLIGHLREDFDFTVATSAHDLHAGTPYPAEALDAARARAGVQVLYLPRGRALLPALMALLDEPWDLVYLNSFLSPGYTTVPLLLRRLKGLRMPWLLAPRGELMPGALQLKRRKKQFYLGLLRHLGLLRGLHFQGTSPAELRALRGLGLGPAHEAGDLPPDCQPAELKPPALMPEGPLRLVFLARVVPIKNLLFALQALALLRLPVIFDIHGPVGDAHYWQACQQQMARLPAHVQVRYLGALPPGQALGTLPGYELLLLPTQSENNGYVIHEALLSGCIALISDQTPWQGLDARGVGADLPLGSPASFAAAITRFAQMPATERLAWRQRAQAFGLERLNASPQTLATRTMFTQLITPRSASASAGSGA